MGFFVAALLRMTKGAEFCVADAPTFGVLRERNDKQGGRSSAVRKRTLL